MAADNILGKLLIESANRMGGITGGSPLGAGLAGGDGGSRQESAERETRSFQKTVKDAQLKAVGFAKEQPKWWTRMFKTLGIQMGLAGILKQSQVFTSTVGAFFQIFGAMVDVMLAPLVKPVLMPVMRWMARQIPTMGRLSKAIFGFLGGTIMGIVGIIQKIWGAITKVFSKDFWTEKIESVKKFFTEDVPEAFGKVIKNVFSLSFWKEMLRSVWNSTLGGFCFELMKYKICFPTWGGKGGSWSLQGVGTKSETLVTYDADGNPLSYEATQGTAALTEQAFRTGLDKEGNILKGADGKNVLLGIYEWMKLHPDGTLEGYKAYKDNYKATRDNRSLTDFGDLTTSAKEVTEEAKNAFLDLPKWIQYAAGTAGVLIAPALLAKIVANAKNAGMAIVRGTLAPGQGMLGVLRYMATQIGNPASSESIINQMLKGKNLPDAARASLQEFKKHQLKSMFGMTPDADKPVTKGDLLELFERTRGIPNPGAGASTSIRTTTPTSQMGGDPEAYLRRQSPVAEPDAPKVSALSKAKTKLKELTAYVMRQLRNIAGVLRSEQTANAVRNTVTRMTQEIEDLLLPITNSIPLGQEAKGLLAVARVTKSFLLRAIPLVGAGIGLAETAYNINQIARSDLNWLKAEDSPALKRDIERMKGTLGMSGDLFAESAGYGFGLKDWFGAKKFMTSRGAVDVGEAGLYQGAGTNLMHTKSGAILTQLLLGGTSTAAGALGVPGLPFSLPTAMAQEVHRMGVMGQDSQNILDALISNFNQGVAQKDKALSIQIDGLDASMSMPGYL